jgi:hypothetical protein
MSFDCTQKGAYITIGGISQEHRPCQRELVPGCPSIYFYIWPRLKWHEPAGAIVFCCLLLCSWLGRVLC